MEAPITGIGIDGTAAAIQLTLPRVSKALVTSLLEVAAMEAPITGLGIDGTASAIQLTLPRVFGIGTDKAMEPFAYLWIKKVAACGSCMVWPRSRAWFKFIIGLCPCNTCATQARLSIRHAGQS